MDPRLRAAVDTSVGWYDEVFALHAIPTARTGGLWRALAEPPPWHSAVKTLDPGVGVEAVLAALAPLARGTVADSFGDLALADAGFSVLLDGTWLHRPAVSSRGMPAAWTVVRSPELLARWNERHDFAGVLVPAALKLPRLTMLARMAAGEPVGGAVLHDPGTPVVGLSNAWTAAGHELDWEELLAAAYAVHPDRPLTDYATGDDLADMTRAGFTPLGPHRVWVR